MNAYEFANELEIIKNKIIGKEHELGGRAIILYTESANMLRQQADRIAELEKETYFCKTCNRHLEVDDGVVIHDDIVHDENEVFGVQEQKPIAYIDHVSGKPKLIGGYVVSTPYDIPLYTTPQTKPLNDEPIAYVPLLAWEIFSSSITELEKNHMTNEQFIRRCKEVVRARALYENDTQFNTQLHPQTKPLSDEEITQALNDSMEIKGVWGQPMTELNPVKFARTIEAKVRGEK